jgi:hypothetical protein
VSCGLQDLDDLAWWQPYPAEGGGNGKVRPWLPWVIRVVSNSSDFSVEVQEAASVGDLPQSDSNPDCVKWGHIFYPLVLFCVGGHAQYFNPTAWC